MLVTTDYIDLRDEHGPMRTFVAAPREAGTYPGILCFSDIFQLTRPMERACVRLAGYGYVVAAPEIYRRIEPPGTVLPFDDAGRACGLDDAARTPVAHFDEDTRLLLQFLRRHPAVAPGQFGAVGFCIGGHLAFRAALQREVKATVCFYGTGIHNGKLGLEADAGSLQQAGQIRGRLLMVWGAQDPHVPADARAAITTALQAGGVDLTQRLYDAEHAFMRDEGPRFDPQATDEAFGEMVSFLRSVLQG